MRIYEKVYTEENDIRKTNVQGTLRLFESLRVIRLLNDEPFSK